MIPRGSRSQKTNRVKDFLIYIRKFCTRMKALYVRTPVKDFVQHHGSDSSDLSENVVSDDCAFLTILVCLRASLSTISPGLAIWLIPVLY